MRDFWTLFIGALASAIESIKAKKGSAWPSAAGTGEPAFGLPSRKEGRFHAETLDTLHGRGPRS